MSYEVPRLCNNVPVIYMHMLIYKATQETKARAAHQEMLDKKYGDLVMHPYLAYNREAQQYEVRFYTQELLTLEERFQFLANHDPEELKENI